MKQILTSTAAFTIGEMTAALAVLLFAMAGVSGGAMSLHRSFASSDPDAMLQQAQLRAINGITRDVRSARAFKVTDNGARLHLVLPRDYDAGGNPVTPAVAGQEAVYGEPGQWNYVSFYADGDLFIREVNGFPVVLARNFSNLRPSFDDDGPSVIATLGPRPSAGEPRKIASPRTPATMRNTVTLRNPRMAYPEGNSTGDGSAPIRKNRKR